MVADRLHGFRRMRVMPSSSPMWPFTRSYPSSRVPPGPLDRRPGTHLALGVYKPRRGGIYGVLLYTTYMLSHIAAFNILYECASPYPASCFVCPSAISVKQPRAKSKRYCPRM